MTRKTLKESINKSTLTKMEISDNTTHMVEDAVEVASIEVEVDIPTITSTTETVEEMAIT